MLIRYRFPFSLLVFTQLFDHFGNQIPRLPIVSGRNLLPILIRLNLRIVYFMYTGVPKMTYKLLLAL
jgi:hypothetical protein